MGISGEAFSSISHFAFSITAFGSLTDAVLTPKTILIFLQASREVLESLWYFALL